MSESQCASAAATRAAARGDSLVRENLEHHLTECSECADLYLVESMLGQVELPAPRESELPDAQTIWFQSQLVSTREHIERATWPIIALQRLAFTIALFGCGAGIVASWRWVQDWLYALGTELSSSAHLLGNVGQNRWWIIVAAAALSVFLYEATTLRLLRR